MKLTLICLAIPPAVFAVMLAGTGRPRLVRWAVLAVIGLGFAALLA